MDDLIKILYGLFSLDLVYQNIHSWVLFIYYYCEHVRKV